MSKKISLGVTITIALIAMAVTFSLTMVVSMNMFNSTVSSVKSKERQYNKLAEIDAVKGAAPSLRWIDEISGPDGLNAGALMSSVAWVAASLLQTYQMEQHGAAEGGAA